MKAQVSLEFLIALTILIASIGSIISIQNHNSERIGKSVERLICRSDIDLLVSRINRKSFDRDYKVPEFSTNIADGKIMINEDCWARVIN